MIHVRVGMQKCSLISFYGFSRDFIVAQGVMKALIFHKIDSEHVTQ